MSFPSLANEFDVRYMPYHSDKELKYLDSCSSLPISRPVDFPNLIETEPEFNELTNPTNLRLCDGIVTVLFKYDPDFLSRFLDFSIPEVFILREEHGSSLGDLVIWRKDRTVTVSFNWLLRVKHHGIECLMIPQCGFYNRLRNILDYDTRVVSTIHADGRWESISADGASMQFMPKPISPVEVTKAGMRMGQAMLIQERWNTHEPVEIHLSKSAWWDTVVHFAYGDRSKFTRISEAGTTWNVKANEMARRRGQLPKHRCGLKYGNAGWRSSNPEDNDR